MKVTLNDVGDPDNTITLSESERGNVIIQIHSYRSEVIVRPDELLRAVRLFVTDRNRDTST